MATDREQLGGDEKKVKEEGEKSVAQKSSMADGQLLEGRTEIEKKKMAAEPIDRDDETKLKGLPYYHGYLSRDDIAMILRDDGDFLLRLSEVDGVNPMAGRQLILSVNATQGQPDGSKLLKLRNVVVTKVAGQYRIDTHGFATVKELVAYFQQNNYSGKQGIIRLKKGVALQKWEFSHADVTLGKVLGEGAFGEVREGVLTRKKKSTRVAVKLGKGQSEATKEKIKEMMKEAQIQTKLKHPNVVRLYGIMALEQPIGILLELVDGGNLGSFLRTGEGLVDIKEKVSMCSGAARGLSYIHSRLIIHRDIAARNCLYNGKDKLVKISDFGLSKKIAEMSDVYKIRTGVKFPIKWLSPETIKDLVFSMKTDVYSYGVLVWEVFANGKEPWDGVGNAETKRKVTSGEFLSLAEECPAKLKDFVETKIYQLDSQKRCNMGDVVRFMEILMTESKMSEYQAQDSSTMQTTKTENTAQASSREHPADDFYKSATPKGKGPRKIPSKENTMSAYSNETTAKSSEPVKKDRQKSVKEVQPRKKRTLGSKKFNRY